MHKIKACSMLMMAGALVACGKDKHQEPAMQPAAGEEWQQREQTEPAYTGEEPTQAPDQPTQEPGMEQQPGGEWQPETQTPEQPMGEEPMEPQTEAGAQAADTDARMLAQARCQVELRCDNVGQGKRYPNIEACRTAMAAESQRHLAMCPTGVTREALSSCVTAIQSMECDQAMTDLNQVAQCRTTMLCAP